MESPRPDKKKLLQALASERDGKAVRAHREENEETLESIADGVRGLLLAVGEFPDRDGLQRTPMRVARSMMFLTSGYTLSLHELVNDAVFEADHDEMVVVRDIDIFSLCEHHMLPFFGKAHIGYIPRSKVIGLSKLARIADMYARRLQIQERLTKQIAMAVMEVLDPQGVAVVVEATHMCMAMRGAEKPSATTTTSSVLGVFRDDPLSRSEFFQHINR